MITFGGQLKGEFPTPGYRLAATGGSLEPGEAVLLPVIVV